MTLLFDSVSSFVSAISSLQKIAKKRYIFKPFVELIFVLSPTRQELRENKKLAEPENKKSKERKKVLAKKNFLF
jgi:hypothetical protein